MRIAFCNCNQLLVLCASILQKLTELHNGEINDELLDEQSDRGHQSYTALMQQMTLISHLQSDDMGMPIQSFTSFLQGGILSQVCTKIWNFF